MGTVIVSPERLREAVLGRDRFLSRGQACALLAASGQADRESVLAEVLENSNEPATARSSAAIALGRIQSRSAEEILVRNLPKADAPTKPDILRSLARIGGQGTIRQIESLQAAPDNDTKQAALFAARLISYRHRLPGYEWPQPRVMPAPGASPRSVRIAPAGPEHATRVLEDLARDPFGIQLARNGMVTFECGAATNTICLNEEFAGPQAVSRLLGRKAVFGTVALPSPETGVHSVAYLLLVTPTAGGVEILATRPSGRAVLAGTGRVAGSAVSFALRAVTRPGAAATSIEGSFEDGALLIASAAVSAERLPRLTPERTRR